MSSDLPDYEKSILCRDISRKKVVPELLKVGEAQESSKVTSSSEKTKSFSSVNFQFDFTIDDLVNKGNDKFYAGNSNKKKGKKVYANIPRYYLVGVPNSLEKCLQWAKDNNGVVASLPYLIGGLSEAPAGNYLRKHLHTALSEENVGIDTKGVVKRGEPIVVLVHGGGILTPERIRKAYNEGLTPWGAATFTQDEWANLLAGKLPTGESVQIYTVDDVRKGNVKEPFGKYVVVLSLDEARKTISGPHNKESFMKNPLVLARAGTLEYLEKYFDNIKRNNKVCNWHLLNHLFRNIYDSLPKGLILYSCKDDLGICGNKSLYNIGRFVGVARN